MKKVILAVDDNEDFLSMLKEILDGSGYDTKTLSDPTKTEEYIEQFHPGLLIIDVFMPKRSGFNLLEDFREKQLYVDIPKIFLTCLDDDIEKMTARACGVTQYITKPFKPEELISMVKKVMSRKGGSKGK
ncbi:MAG TPA: response regulator [Candidatus Omnitrophota bacterium]|nr:response regulator [Candidatus Omnitrophota bacterium]HPS20206.1 response regulator [Candidatus Omnitrophota bacterium]